VVFGDGSEWLFTNGVFGTVCDLNSKGNQDTGEEYTPFPKRDCQALKELASVHAHGILYLFGDGSHADKRGTKNRVAQKGRQSQPHPWFFGLRFVLLMAAWAGYRMPPGIHVVEELLECVLVAQWCIYDTHVQVRGSQNAFTSSPWDALGIFCTLATATAIPPSLPRTSHPHEEVPWEASVCIKIRASDRLQQNPSTIDREAKNAAPTAQATRAPLASLNCSRPRRSSSSPASSRLSPSVTWPSPLATCLSPLATCLSPSACFPP
jgi:hypothetical protein